jgi:hypothetical protein
MSSGSDAPLAAPLGRTAVLAFVAAIKAAVKPKKHEKYFKGLGLDLHPQSVNRARRLREVDGREAPSDPDQRDWIWKSVEVDAQKLGFDQIVAWLPRPNVGARQQGQSAMLESLRGTPGVVRIIEGFDDTFMIEALTTSPLAKRRLQSRLREICPEVFWCEVRQVDKGQPQRGWERIVKAVAAEEGRLAPGAPTAMSAGV